MIRLRTLGRGDYPALAKRTTGVLRGEEPFIAVDRARHVMEEQSERCKVERTQTSTVGFEGGHE